MRTISLHQPHASAVPYLAKGVETRGWPIPSLGPLAIHAAQRCVRRELAAYRRMPCWQAALAGTALMGEEEPDYATCLPFGAVVGVCEVVACRPHGTFTLAELRTPRTRRGLPAGLTWTEEDMGIYQLGRYGWMLARVRRLVEPLPWKGHQSFFDVPDHLILERLPPDGGCGWEAEFLPLAVPVGDPAKINEQKELVLA